MKYHIVALFTVSVWGLTFVSTKILLTSFSPLWILLLRFVIGFFALCTIRPRLLKLKSKKDERLFIAAGATGIGAYYLLENVALVYSTATAVGVIVAVSPLFTALISAATGDRSSINPRFFIGFALAIAGLTIVGASNGTDAAQSLFGECAFLGDLLALGAAFVWAIYSLLVKRISNIGYETIAATKRTFFWGVLFIAAATAAFGDPLPNPSSTISNPVYILNLLFLGLIASAACFATWGIAVKHLGAAFSTTYIYLVPAITATASILILGEPVTVPIVVGLAMTVAGLIISQKR